MQNVFSPILSVQQPPPQMDQESNMDLHQMLMSTLEAQQQGTASSSSNGSIPSQLFEAIFAQALSQTNQQSQNLQLGRLAEQIQLNASSDQSSPRASNVLAEDTSTVAPTPNSVTASGASQPADEEAAKFMAQLLKDAPANLLQQLPQPTSPTIQDASSLLEQLQFMGLLGANGNSQGAEATEWKNAIANGAFDLASLFNTQPATFLNSSGQLNQRQQAPSNDAYCDICNKHLCNRYFLKTHRQKKHQIVDPPSTTATPTTSLNLSNFQGLQSPFKREAGSSVGVEPTTPNRLPESDILFAQFSDPPSKMPKLAPITIAQEDHSPLKSPNQLSAPHTATRFSCDACDKDFDTTSALLQHRLQNHQGNTAFQSLIMQNHGQQINTAGAAQTPISSPSGHQTPQRQQTPTSQQHTPNTNNLLNQLLPGIQLPPAFQLPQLFNFGNLPSAFPFNGELDRMAQQLSSTASRTSTIPTQQAPKTPKRLYTSTQRNFCDLCNKEVCNKYFLRTHMLKMHNIIIDENKSVIANIDTLEREKEGGLFFRCDYCKIKFDTRQQLRDHKKEVHNIAPTTQSVTSAATGSSASSDCDASSKTPNSATIQMGGFFASQQLSSSNQESHHEQMNPSSSASSTAGTAGSNPMTSCHFCPESFSDNNKLTGHLMSAHYQELMSEFSKIQSSMPTTLEDDLVNQVAMQMARNNQLEKAKEKQKDITFKCNHCQREYTDASKFNDHLQLHLSVKKFSPKKNKRKILAPRNFVSMKPNAVFSEKIKKMRQLFTCTKCQRRFTNRVECQNHVLAHLHEQKSASRTLLEGDEDQTQLGEEGVDEELLSSYMLEEVNREPSEIDFRCSAVEDVVKQLHQSCQKNQSNKEEKHSHTSGSASPSSTHHMPEGFFHPLNEKNSRESAEKNYQTQSFVMRALDLNQSGVLSEVCDQLLGTLPVRQVINRPFRLTFDFQPLQEETADLKPKLEENIEGLQADI